MRFCIFLLRAIRNFSSIRKICLVLLCFNVTSYVCAYAPAILSGKYQTGLIDYNFYYRGSGAGKGWVPTLVDDYGGRDNQDAILAYRRGLVPGTTIDALGSDLYTISLVDFGANGPKFLLTKNHYESYRITTTSIEIEPWKLVAPSMSLGENPNFGGQEYKRNWFRWNFHNCLSPCLFQVATGQDRYVRIFLWFPNKYLYSSTFSEGGLHFKYKKSDLAFENMKTYNIDIFHWDRGVSRRQKSTDYIFASCWGNYRGLVFEFPNDNSANIFLFFLNLPGDSRFDECAVAYQMLWSADSSQKASGKPAWGNWTDKDTSCFICPRFIRAGSYVYCAASKGGYWMNFGRMDSAGNSVSLGTHISDCYLETTQSGSSYSAYNFDFCLLNKDGTPCTKNSQDDTTEDTRKILCVFSLGGGGNNSGMTSAFNWNSTYINWPIDYAAGILSSELLPANGGSINATYSAWAQNTIYVTGLNRRDGTCVNSTNTSKSDLYRLYLNSHKIVPYTSPSGKHYMIFAYCYPGKKQHLYLGYAQYFIDSNYRVRLTTKIVFKGGDSDEGWGDSFGPFIDCTRIISMDLSNGHLWITFVKDSGVNPDGRTTDQKKQDAHFNYFHILVTDLIQE